MADELYQSCLGIMKLSGTIDAVVKSCNAKVINNDYTNARKDCSQYLNREVQFYYTIGEDIFYADKGRNGDKTSCDNAMSGLNEYIAK
jgi:hypothetical protein